jgi:hypothetical protein|eukprot:COSAG01_NODE_3944_length_5508_cov_66.132557_3_plen_93_part_00
MLPLGPYCAGASSQSCKLVRTLRGAGSTGDEQAQPSKDTGDQSMDGVGYYVLRAGAVIQPHAGPTNERLTCHLTLRVSPCPRRFHSVIISAR